MLPQQRPALLRQFLMMRKVDRCTGSCGLWSPCHRKRPPRRELRRPAGTQAASAAKSPRRSPFACTSRPSRGNHADQHTPAMGRDAPNPGSSDLLATNPDSRHGLVQVAVGARIINGEPCSATRMTTNPALGKSSRRTPMTHQRRALDRTLSRPLFHDMANHPFRSGIPHSSRSIHRYRHRHRRGPKILRSQFHGLFMDWSDPHDPCNPSARS